MRLRILEKFDRAVVKLLFDLLFRTSSVTQAQTGTEPATPPKSVAIEVKIYLLPSLD